MTGEIHVVIMAGGVGSRLYPISTPERPKQFLDILGAGKTLIELTYERFLEVSPMARFWVVTSEDYVHFVEELLPDIPSEQILAEPVARNTAPCIAYACTKIKKKYPDANIVVTPSDAYVPDYKAFALTMRDSLGFTAQRHAVVCIGICPDHAETQYGYIQQGEAQAPSIYKVASFKEKPSEDVAKAYLAAGGYMWNAGIFVWNVQTIDAELRKFAPQIMQRMDELEGSLYGPDESAALERIFPLCDRISIDYAVMEKADCIFMARGDWEWSDLGSFAAIEKITNKKIEI